MYEPGLGYFVDMEGGAIWWWRGWIRRRLGGREDGDGEIADRIGASGGDERFMQLHQFGAACAMPMVALSCSSILKP